MDDASSLSNPNLSNLALLTKQYENYLQDPTSVDPSWQAFFQGWKFASEAYEKFLGETAKGTLSIDIRVFHLIEAYRCFGHLKALFNPLFDHSTKNVPELQLASYGFSEKDLESLVSSCGFLPEDKVALKLLIQALEQAYCSSIGMEYKGLDLPGIEEFIQSRFEPYRSRELTKERKKETLFYLNRAELFESFIHTKYVGQKRFSLEGCETLIPMLDELLEFGAVSGLNEIVIGMAHRGRLNVLANVLNKPYSQIFHEFESRYIPETMGTSGDVKYHKGFSGKMKTRSGKEIDIILAANPSHLEAVDPVVEGMARAKQKGDPAQWKKILPVLIHGDAAVAGQGIVYEVLQLGKLEGYATGGTLHMVVNNNIGFTTLPKDSRSTRYCTDIAKAFSAPVFHVNAEDVESCIYIMKLALEVRNTFHCDVFIDLNGYRKYGHNEGDEPMFTQPLEYRAIRQRQSIREIYIQRLIEEGVLTLEEASQEEVNFKKHLEEALAHTQKLLESSSKKQAPVEKFEAPKTCVEGIQLKELLQKICHIPEGLHIHPKVERLLKERLSTLQKEAHIPCMDWGTAELLAYASLLVEKVPVRISGQDVRRGTFSHRHAVWVDQENAANYFPLSGLSSDQAPCELYNSSLSEYGVLGFEFGYSIVNTSSLVIWEAQFGDFSNGAQIIIDQFIAPSATKWGMISAITLFLPHGYEGQGPEHSSGRMERYLQLCADENMRVVNCSTPAQLFHLIRRQALSKELKPLILFTPKAMLRHPKCLSSWKEFTEGGFHSVLADAAIEVPRRALLCSGKVYYDLLEEREKRKALDCAIIRIEELYPFDKTSLLQFLQPYESLKEIVWVQEEHENMGAWQYIRPFLEEALPTKKITYAGRKRSSSPAAGSYALHKKEYEEFMNQAFSV